MAKATLRCYKRIDEILLLKKIQEKNRGKLRKAEYDPEYLLVLGAMRQLQQKQISSKKGF